MQVTNKINKNLNGMKQFGELPLGAVFTLKNKENIYIKAEQSQNHSKANDDSGHAVLLSGGRIFPMEYGRFVFEVAYNFEILGLK